MRDEAWAVLASALMVLTGAPAALAGSSGQAEQAPGPGMASGEPGVLGPAVPGDGSAPPAPAQGEDLQETLLVPTISGTAEQPNEQQSFTETDVSNDGWVVTVGSKFNPGQPFVALFQPDGEVAWAKELDTGMDEAWPTGVGFGPDGSVYVTEVSRDWPPESVAFSSGLYKFARSGELLWEHSFDHSDASVWPTTWGVATASSGEVAVAGGLSKLPDFHGSHVRVATFDSDGTHRWTASSASMPASWGLDLAFDTAGNLHVAGHGYDVNPSKHWRTWDQDALYWRFDAEGNERVNLNLGEEGPREAFHALDVTPSGSVYLAGYNIDESWDFSTLRPLVAQVGPLGQIGQVDQVTQSYGYYNSLDAKASGALVAASPWPDPSHVDGLDDRGNLLWSEQDVLPGADGEWIDSAAVGPADRIHVAGTVTGSDTGQDAFVATLADAYSPAAQAEQALVPEPLS